MRDLAVLPADGGDSLTDLRVQRERPDLFGNLGSDANASRVTDSADEHTLGRLRETAAAGRAEAWRSGARPERAVSTRHNRLDRTVIDVDGSLTSVHSEQEQAHGRLKGGCGHHLLLAYLERDGEVLVADSCRPGNAGANSA